ncbi:e5e9f74d-df07-4417-a18e-9a93af0eb178-CDS [Sclerotinia trifoliorum]|uniref:E5e9f74d-df07-4417-a18e-9a93af0eb178-CDS n=1 Tax=Sclerotinia trifoliorum TaxID=28548 RepID=A0A8H2VPL4_9HELO|nr:e5e9f74d-df07-4417-a18e-9a93af0eb178-CDS [Sclerotinia trifoliorum]
MTVNHEVIKLQQQNNAILLCVLKQKNTSLASKWLKEFKGSAYDPKVDMKDCLEHVAVLDSDEKNIYQWILHLEEYNQWLQEEKSSILDIELQTPPTSLNNPVSFNSALVATTLRSTDQFPVLAFFCRHRNLKSSSMDNASPVALVKSLTGQLLRFIVEHRPFIDLSPLENQKLFLKARTDLNNGLLLLDTLLSSLPRDDMVFLIIDSLIPQGKRGEKGH